MKLTINRKELATAFGLANSIIKPRSPNQILTQAKFIVADGLTIIGSNAEAWVTTKCPCDAKASGEFLISADQFNSILNTLTDDYVEIVINKDKAGISCGNAKFDMTLIDGVDSYPVPQDDQYSFSFTTDCESLHEAIGMIDFCTASESARYALTGIKFEIDKDSSGQVTLIGTDGKICGYCSINITTESKLVDFRSLVIPNDTIKSIKSIISKCDGKVTVHCGISCYKFETDCGSITAIALEGRYPPWRDVIPKTSKHKANFSSDDLLSALSQVTVATDDESRGVDFDFTEGSLELSAKREGVKASSVIEDIEADGSFTIDPGYLKPVLQKSESIQLRWKDGKSEIMVNTPKSEYVIMPLSRGE